MEALAEITDRANALAGFVGWTVAEAFAFVNLAASTPTLADATRLRFLVGELNAAFCADACRASRDETPRIWDLISPVGEQ